MKRVTASDARRNWFRLLDEVAAGEVVCIERGGRRILLQREADAAPEAEVPDYASILSVPDAERSDEWTWDWSPGTDLTLREGPSADAEFGSDDDPRPDGATS